MLLEWGLRTLGLDPGTMRRVGGRRALKSWGMWGFQGLFHRNKQTTNNRSNFLKNALRHFPEPPCTTQCLVLFLRSPETRPVCCSVFPSGSWFRMWLQPFTLSSRKSWPMPYPASPGVAPSVCACPHRCWRRCRMGWASVATAPHPTRDKGWGRGDSDTGPHCNRLSNTIAPPACGAMCRFPMAGPTKSTVGVCPCPRRGARGPLRGMGPSWAAVGLSFPVI